MINIRKRNNLYEYRFEAGKVNGKRKRISKSGFKTKRDAYLAGQRAYEEFISGEDRYKSLDKLVKNSKEILDENKKNAEERYKYYQELANTNKE
jgi:hypothetical protein